MSATDPTAPPDGAGDDEGVPGAGSPLGDDVRDDDGPDAGAAAGPDAEADLDPAAQVAELAAERDDLADQVLRGRADYDNLNKRRHREVAEARDRGAAGVVERLLEVLDTFGFALQAAELSSDTQLAKGVQLVHDQLVAALADLGLEEVPGVGATFDPSHHEALMSDTDGEERDEPEVREVLRTGYRFRGQLLRAASVKVVG